MTEEHRENEADEEVLKKSIELGQSEDCTRRLDALLYCYSPPNQLGAYYNRGTIDSCKEPLQNLYYCMKIKTNQTVEEKQRLIDIMNQSRDNSPSASVWHFKKNPSSGWNVPNEE
mmetsp:Transcript_15687/g.18325  ORF Transcript_15687/g.18325 Transcript_15687/m.18325 type:complete len:115 (+) Transcript_15687:68-412(+)